jgi:hypothetical protein
LPLSFNYGVSLPMATQQTARVTITATDMTAAERGFRAIQELIVAAAMIGTIRPRRENFISAVIAKARRQLPRILPIDPNDHAAIDAAAARHPTCTRGLRRKHKQAECRRKISHQASARIGAAAEWAMKQVSSSSTDPGGGNRLQQIAICFPDAFPSSVWGSEDVKIATKLLIIKRCGLLAEVKMTHRGESVFLAQLLEESLLCAQFSLSTSRSVRCSRDR